MALLPTNGDNDVKAGVVKENVELSRESDLSLVGIMLMCRIDKTRRYCCLLVVHGDMQIY